MSDEIGTFKSWSLLSDPLSQAFLLHVLFYISPSFQSLNSCPASLHQTQGSTCRLCSPRREHAHPHTCCPSVTPEVQARGTPPPTSTTTALPVSLKHSHNSPLNFLQQNLFTCSSLQLSQLTQALGLLPPHSILSSVLELVKAAHFSGQVDSLIRATHICTAHTSQDYRQLQGTHRNSEG